MARIELNPVETKMLAALVLVRTYCTKQHVYKEEYNLMMGAIRDAIAAAEKKEMGCPHGLHFEDCLCTLEEPGFIVRIMKRKDAQKKANHD